MASRVGMCGGCSARFKVPESYSGDRAKCRKCGGVIEIEPAAAPFGDAAFADAPQESETESVTTEATAFVFASMRARPSPAEYVPEQEADPAPEADFESSDESSSEPSVEPSVDEPAESEMEAAAEPEPEVEAPPEPEPEPELEPESELEMEAPVEPIAPPPPQRNISAPRPAQRPAPSSATHAESHVEKHSTPPHRTGAETHHEKRHLRIGAAIAALLVLVGVSYLLITSQGADAPEETAAPSARKTPPTRGAKASLAATDSTSGKAAAGSKAGSADGSADGSEDDSATEAAEGAEGSEAPADGETAASEADTETEAEAAPTPLPEPILAKFEFVALERAPGTTDEEWDRMQELSATLHDGGKARKAALKELLEYGIKAVPVLVNSLNGLDLAKYSQWVDGAEVSRFIQDDLLAETILIPYHGAFSTEAKEVRHNQVVLKSMVDYWNTQVNEPARWGALLQKYEEKRAIRGDRRDGN